MSQSYPSPSMPQLSAAQVALLAQKSLARLPVAGPSQLTPANLRTNALQNGRQLAPLPQRSSRARTLGKTNDPVPLYAPLHRSQAVMTTFPSRLRLGVSTLMQPINTKMQKQAAKEAAKLDFSGRRARTQVNYAEFAEMEDLAVDGSDDDSASQAGGSNAGLVAGATARQRAMQRRNADPSKASQSPAPSSERERGPKPIMPEKSYLGQEPAGHMLIIEPARKATHIYPPQQNLEDEAEIEAVLIPIRVEIDTDSHRIRDCFLWNMNENNITPEIFAEIFCSDAGLPHAYREQVAVAIRTQIDEHTPTAETPVADPNPAANELDLRVMINIDVQISTLRYMDKLEWDLGSTLSPETFATHLCAELALSGEAAPIIAHAIQEEIMRTKRDCIDVGLIGLAEGEERMTSRGPKMMEDVWREWNASHEFGPKIDQLSVDDLERLEIERERLGKRQRKAGGGVSARSRKSDRYTR